MANAGSFGMPKRDHRLWARSFYGLQKDTVQSPRVVSNRLVNHSSSKHYDRCVCAKQSVGLKWFLSDLLHKSAPNKVLKLPKHPNNLPRTPTAAPTPRRGPRQPRELPSRDRFSRIEKRALDGPQKPPRESPWTLQGTPRIPKASPDSPPMSPAAASEAPVQGPFFEGRKTGPGWTPKDPA